MKWIIFSLSILIIGCSPSRRIQWHIGQLEKLERRHPELFEPNSVDTVIKQKLIEVKTVILKVSDSTYLERLRKDSAYYKQKSDSNESELKRSGVNDCDSVIKAMKLSNNTQSKITTIYKQSKCVVMPKFIDTLGVKIMVMGVNGEVDISVKVDSIHVHKDCPPCFTPKQREYWEFWQFWTWVILTPIICCTFLIFALRLILKR